MVTTPADTPLTNPVNEPTVAMLVLLLLQVPPAVASLKVINAPVHNNELPVIAAGAAFTDMNKDT
jgi:hypothetical protein